MDIVLRVRRRYRSAIGTLSVRGIEFVVGSRVVDKSGWNASSKESGFLGWVAKGDVAEAVEDFVVVEDVVCCYQECQLVFEGRRC